VAARADARDARADDDDVEVLCHGLRVDG
jgi:hypothetical protein